MKLQKLLSKHIKNQNFVKVYTATDNYQIEKYEGFIFEENKKYILMNDMLDFNYDGFVLLRKADINEIKYTENEKFFSHILKKEKIKKRLFNKRKKLKLKLSSLEKMMKNLKSLKIPIICEHLYEKEDVFQIGSIKKVYKNRAMMRYFNSRGEFDLKLLPISYRTLTIIRIDSPYANIFYKYAK